jgi:predicted DNA-binding transcriptional regulator YafY
MNQILRHAMFNSDKYVIEMDYDDAKGNRTRRVVSPIRFMGSYRFLGFCLCREEPRQFQLSRCKNIRLVPAEEVLMPMQIQNAFADGELVAN